MGAIGFSAVIIILIVILALLSSCIRIVPQAQALVVERLGAFLETCNPAVRRCNGSCCGVWRQR